jgi:hypothetical protein
MDLLKYIIAVIFSTTGIGVIITYLGKKFIDKSLELGLEKYRNNLATSLESHKADLNKQTEEFKASLRILELEHQVKYSMLHEERASVIKKLYSLIIELQIKLSELTSMFQGPNWKKDDKCETDAKKSLNELKNFFLPNRIYFKNDLCVKIDEIINLSWKIIVDMSINKSSVAYVETGPEMAEAIRKWNDIDKRITSEINSARLSLEKEFRTLIGSE